MTGKNDETVIGVDFDHTVFDTDIQFEVEFGSEEAVDKAHSDSLGAFNPAGYRAETGDDPYELLEDSEKYLYSDVKGALEQMPGKVVIVTRGVPEWQKAKVRASGIMDVADEIYVINGPYSEDKTGAEHIETGENPDLDYLIDNKILEVENVDLPEEKSLHLDREYETLYDKLDEIKSLEQ